MPREILISVIVPVYNVEKYIEDCILSLRSQQVDNVEFIIINDGSTDDSIAIAKESSKNDKRFLYFDKANGGLSDARNCGMQHATGKYFLFVDSDDFLPGNSILTYKNIIESNNVDLVVSRFHSIREDQNFKTDSLSDGVVDLKCEIHQNGSLINFLYGKDHLLAVYSWGKLIRRELALKYSFPLSRLHEDEFTTYKYLLSAKSAIFINKVLYLYRVRKGSIMSSGLQEKNVKDRIDAMSERFLFLASLAPSPLLIKTKGKEREYIFNYLCLRKKRYTINDLRHEISLIDRYNEELIRRNTLENEFIKYVIKCPFVFIFRTKLSALTDHILARSRELRKGHEKT